MTYNTPVFGLGCRSGNYIIYAILALGCFMLEMAGGAVNDRLRRRRHADNGDDNHNNNSDDARRSAKDARKLKSSTVALAVLEVASCVQLLGIRLGQPVGLYNSCICRASMWSRIAGVGGYVHLQDGGLLPRALRHAPLLGRRHRARLPAVARHRRRRVRVVRAELPVVVRLRQGHARPAVRAARARYVLRGGWCCNVAKAARRCKNGRARRVLAAARAWRSRGRRC
jgi:hypothetical protein